MPGGVAGAQLIMAAPYADFLSSLIRDRRLGSLIALRFPGDLT